MQPMPAPPPVPTCLVCKTPRHTLRLSLGELAVSDFPATHDTPQTRAPLNIHTCDNCGLAQLIPIVPRSALFGAPPYWYASAINGTMREELRHVVRTARTHRPLSDGEWVLDIGANDGTLLRAWRDHQWEGRPNRIAVEPAHTFRHALRDAAELILLEPFPTPNLEPYTGRIAAITTIAMIYSTPDPSAVVEEISRLLTPDGVWIVQWQDLDQMLVTGAIDNVCHEHVTYPSLLDVTTWAAKAELTLVDVETRTINGGSLRATFRPTAWAQDHAEVPAMLEAVRQVGPHPTAALWDAFNARARAAIHDLQSVVAAANDAGHTVDLLGASTKGNTLLQLARLDAHNIRQCWERHPGKIGRYTITGIPIVSEADGRAHPPDLVICPIWQFRDAVVEREAEYLAEGGRIYFPLGPQRGLVHGVQP